MGSEGMDPEMGVTRVHRIEPSAGRVGAPHGFLLGTYIRDARKARSNRLARESPEVSHLRRDRSSWNYRLRCRHGKRTAGTARGGRHDSWHWLASAQKAGVCRPGHPRDSPREWICRGLLPVSGCRCEFGPEKTIHIGRFKTPAARQKVTGPPRRRFLPVLVNKQRPLFALASGSQAMSSRAW